jgi:cyclic beta-1,2-glucan synthetase
MIDNLRRSLLAPSALLCVFVGWMLPLPQALIWTALTAVMHALPRLLSLPFDFLPARAGVTLRSHFAALWSDTVTALGQIAVSLVLLADTAATMLDAVVRTCWRLLVSRQHLLEWMTAAQAGSSARPGLAQQYLSMLPGLVLGLCACGIAWFLNPSVWPLPLVFGLLWAMAPAIARAISLPQVQAAASALSAPQAQELRLIARRTWRYFETFVTPEDNFLPPDNFQEIPRPVVATRTSPTNIGLYLLSTVAAHDMGWIGQRAALQRMHDTLQTVQRMPRFRGHLYNWHDTRDLRVLDPAYVSSVDSGNLAGHLIAVAQACRAWSAETAPDNRVVRQAMGDCALLARRSLGTHAQDLDLIRDLAAIAAAAADPETPLTSLTGPMERAVALTGNTLSEAAFWTTAMHSALADHLADLASPHDARLLDDVEALCRSLTLEMDFRFLLEPDKKLLSIGFSVATNRLDANCYDLLASEARLASLFAIAKGDVETRHWFRLGRPATPIGSGSALISWSGSMFEYLMPSLVMRAPAGLCGGDGDSLGDLGILLQRPRPGDDLSVFELRCPGSGTEAGPEREPGDRALCHGTCGNDRPRGRSEQLCRPCKPWCRGALRLLRSGGFHALAPAVARDRGDRPQLHGASSGHDDRGHRQYASEWPHAGPVPCRADDPGR